MPTSSQPPETVIPWPIRVPACRLALVMACTAASLPAHALQLIDAVDGVAVEAIVSIKEPTRIRIEGAPITDVFGSVYSSHCTVPAAAPVGGVGTVATTPLAATVNPLGEVVVECDRDKGEIYVRPVGTSNKPVNLFIASAHATYTLLLRRSDTPADTIVIRDRSQRPATFTPTENRPASPAPAPVRAMKALLLAMATDQASADYQIEEMHRPVQLRAALRLTQIRQYQGRQLVGEKYLLHNAGTEPVELSEQEFDRDDGVITAVAIEHHRLGPDEATTVYVIRRGSAP